MLYKDLVVWQKAHGLAVSIIKTADAMRRSPAAEIVARQLIRAATSISANIAEGYGRGTGKDYARFLDFAFASANEVDNWLTLAKDAELLSKDMADQLLANNGEVIRMLWTIRRRIREGNATTARGISESGEEYTMEVADQG